METFIYEGTLAALTSIAHNGGQSFGIETKLRRERFVQPDGSVEEIPLLSGNGLRGMLRDRGMWHMCRALGYQAEEGAEKIPGLSLSAFYFLFSGGALGEGSTQGIDVDYARRLRQTIPLISIFGGAVGNQILPGKLKVGKAIPICAETEHLLPATYRKNGSASSVWEYLQTEMYTRKDDERNEKLRQVLAPQEVKQLPSRAKAKPAAKAQAQTMFADDLAVVIEPEIEAAPAEASDKRKPQQMMYYVETFAAGTPFFWKLILEDVDDVEYDAFMTVLAEFSRLPYVGGKSAVGLGEVAVKFDKRLQIDSRVQMESTALARPAGAAYSNHLREKGAEIRKILETV